MSEFTHNNGSKGGSIYTDTESNSSNLILTNTKAVNNLGDEGGFLLSKNIKYISYKDCLFDSNKAIEGGV